MRTLVAYVVLLFAAASVSTGCPKAAVSAKHSHFQLFHAHGSLWGRAREHFLDGVLQI